MKMPQSHQHLVKRLIECWNSGKMNIIDEIVSSKFVRHGDDHIQRQGQIRGAAGYKQAVSESRQLLTDFHTESQDLVEQGDKIAFRFRTTGNHKGQKIEFEGANIIRVEGDRIAEDWVYYDSTGLAERLGQKKAAA
jgi:predicted ester cyclase